ncbi:hypothetical protein N7450_005256 [Penicillium hetheringtonii]|nr:hypothetical protein N7450_005256 [Penicillium hetheringtonii]
MLIDGQKWACEACIRGHRVTSCKHHDRPLIRIKRKGRPFATCTVCQSTPCTAPSEHARAKREAELKTPTKKAAHARLYPRHHNPHGFLPIAPRPSTSSKSDKRASATSQHSVETLSSSTRVSRSGSTSASASVSESHTPIYPDSSSRRDSALTADWSGSEGSGTESSSRTRSTTTKAMSRTSSAAQTSSASSQPFLRSAPENLTLDPLLVEHTFDPMYSLLPSTISGSEMAQTIPMISPLEGGNPFDIPMDPSLTLNDSLGYLENMDVDLTEGFPDEVFHVEDWSRYMWSPETGFEHLDTGFPPVTLPPVTQ